MVKMLRNSLGMMRLDRIRNDNIRGQSMLDVLDRKSGRPDWNGFDMDRGGIVNISVEG